MNLRPATPDDIPELAALGRASFAAAFGHLYDPADLAAFLDASRSHEKIGADIADPKMRIQLAEDEGTLLGYCQIVLGKGFAERPEPQSSKPAILSQLYCDPSATGRGIGATLMDWALAEARGWGADEIQLSVWSGNFGAQRFYQRYGFSKIADIDFWVGNHRDDEFLYALGL